MLRPVHDTKADAEAVHDVLAAVRDASGDDPGGGEDRRVRERAFVRHLARTDPGGCWLATDDGGQPVGAALASRREGTWALGMFGVLPAARGEGTGRELLAAALLHGRACLRGIVCLPDDPRAAAAFRRAGFTLHPAMRLTGQVERARLAALDGAVHEGSAKDRDLLDSVDRRTRGGAHGPDHEELLRHMTLLVADDLAGSGYAYLDEEGRVEPVAATSRRLATRLLTAALLLLPETAEARIRHLTAEQEWAVDVGLTAGLALHPDGYTALRGMRPPTPWLPSGPLL